jgi:hypothetical protein
VTSCLNRVAVVLAILAADCMKFLQGIFSKKTNIAINRWFVAYLSLEELHPSIDTRYIMK